mgnify:CR=1 FL=1
MGIGWESKERNDDIWLLESIQKKLKNVLKLFEPYSIQLSQGKLEDVPQEAIDAYNKAKKWAWEQGQ